MFKKLLGASRLLPIAFYLYYLCKRSAKLTTAIRFLLFPSVLSTGNALSSVKPAALPSFSQPIQPSNSFFNTNSNSVSWKQVLKMDERKRNSKVIDLIESSDDEHDEDCPVVVDVKNPRVAVNRPLAAKKKPLVNPYAPVEKKARRVALKPFKENHLSQGKTTSEHSATKTTIKSTTNHPSTRLSSSSALKNDTGIVWNVGTYNVWFGPPHPEERMKKLAQVLLEHNRNTEPLWFVGFQEVTPPLLAALQPLMEKAGYHVFSQELMGNYGCALAVLQRRGTTIATTTTTSAVPKIIEKGWRPFSETIMNRGFLYVRARLPNSHQQVLFTTTHLESYIGDAGNGQPYTGADQRANQVQEMETFCLQKSQQFSDISVSIITGDLNWDDERIQSVGQDQELLKVLKSSDWMDTWFSIKERQMEQLRGKNGKVAKKNIPTCYTYDSKDSPMLGGNLRRRFDRVLIRAKDDFDVHVKAVQLIGKEAIPGLTWRKESTWNGRVNVREVSVTPSDHFGYVATLQAHNTS